MIQAAAGNTSVPGVVVGVGSDVPDRTDPERFRRKFKMRRPFAIYIGRIDENKGCGELFAHFQRYAAAFPRGMDLVLIGSAVMDVPKHPRIHHLGFLDDRDKFDALAASDLLVMPSYFESLSMVALEAWALGKPVLANGAVRRAARPVHPQQRGALLRELRGVRRGALLARIQRSAERAARAERTGVLQAPLRVAGDRAEVPRDVRAAEEAGSVRLSKRCRGCSPGGAVSFRPPRMCCCESRAGRRDLGPRSLEPRRRGSPRERRTRPPGSRDARVRRRDRPRGARHPGRPSRSAGYESEIFVETADRRLEHLTTDYREMVGAIAPGRRAHPPFLDRLAGVAHRLRAARADGARLSQHHAAGVLPRRAQGSRQAVFSRPPRADRLHLALRARARRLRIQPAGARGARLRADGRAARRARLRAPRSAAEHDDRRAVRRRVDERHVRGPGDSEQEVRGRHPRLSRLPHEAQPALAPAAGRVLQRLRELPRDAARRSSRGSARRTCTSSATSPTRS